jgi:hypothetical protein
MDATVALTPFDALAAQAHPLPPTIALTARSIHAHAPRAPAALPAAKRTLAGRQTETPADVPTIRTRARHATPHRRQPRSSPRTAIPKRVNRVEHVHRGGADREQPLDLGNVRVTRHGRPKRDDQRRGVRALTAMLMRFGRFIGFTRTSNVDENAA